MNLFLELKSFSINSHFLLLFLFQLFKFSSHLLFLDQSHLNLNRSIIFNLLFILLFDLHLGFDRITCLVLHHFPIESLLLFFGHIFLIFEFLLHFNKILKFGLFLHFLISHILNMFLHSFGEVIVKLIVEFLVLLFSFDLEICIYVHLLELLNCIQFLLLLL